MREKEDIRDKRVCTKKVKKVFEERNKLSACYGCGSHVHRFIEKYEYAAKVKLAKFTRKILA